MAQDSKSGLSLIASFCAAVFYALFLTVSTVFVVSLSLLQKGLATRTEFNPDRRTSMTHRKRWFICIDVAATIVTYFATDIFRSLFYTRGHRWPEELPGYGSTFWVHMTMLAALVVAWPAILQWLGWYRARARSWKWRIRNTGAATLLLALVMSTVALVAFREVYPRSQVGFCVVVLPIATGLIRIAVESIERAIKKKRNQLPPAEPVW